MKNKKLIVAVIALVALIGLLIGVYSATRPKTRAEVPQTEPTQTQNQGETAGAPEQGTEEEGSEETSSSVVTITVSVIHKDGSEKEFVVTTEALYLGEVLLAEGIVEGEQGPYGLVISAADGEVADWNVDQSYWALYIGEEYATTGADTTPIFDGGIYRLVYTIG